MNLGLNVSRKFHRVGAICLLVALGGAVGVSVAAAPRAVPAEFQGRWVPSKASCESPVAVVIAAESTDAGQWKRHAGLERDRDGRPRLFRPGLPRHHGCAAHRGQRPSAGHRQLQMSEKRRA